MRDNVLQMAIQNALSRAHPSGPPSNLVIQQFIAPNETTTLGETVLTTLVALTGMVWGGMVSFGTAADWQSCALSDVDAHARPGSIILSIIYPKTLLPMGSVLYAKQ